LHTFTVPRRHEIERGKPRPGGRRIQMLHHLANDGGCVALKQAAEDREGWRQRERMSKTCCTADDYTGDDTSR